MRVAPIIFVSLLLTSCNTESVSKPTFQQIFPDTSRTWAGRLTRDDFYLTRKFEKKLHLESLLNGSSRQELRIWNLSSFYDPQILFVLNETDSGTWLLRKLEFYSAKNDSIENDDSRRISTQFVNSLKLQRFWLLNSQSDLNNGDSYGCFDGENLFLEITDSTRYRCMWYRCPEINKYKDSVFLVASELWSELIGLHIENRRR